MANYKNISKYMPHIYSEDQCTYKPEISKKDKVYTDVKEIIEDKPSNAKVRDFFRMKVEANAEKKREKLEQEINA